MADLGELRSGVWQDLELPELVDGYPTMLAHGERRLLHWMARDVWEGWGAIVDAGCFLGGSTVSFATGLRARATAPAHDRPRPPISTYDRFEAESYMVDAGYFDRWPAIRAGDSFRPAFDELLGDLARETAVHEGDITAAGWPGGPIEILFLDVLKDTTVNDVVSRAFMPSLVAGASVLVQQDYVHGFLPWIHITMELLSDVVEHVVDVSASRVYAVTGEITAERLATFLPLDERVSRARQQELMEQAVAATSGHTRGSLLLAQANLLRMHGDLGRAGALLEQVESSYRDELTVQFDAPGTRACLEQAGWPARA
jgi:hypothetical protein